MLRQASDRLDREILNVSLSPIDKHVVLDRTFNRDGLYHHTYTEANVRKINKILLIYGIDYFRNRRILELGAGHGDIGAFFADLGAQVLCVDGREENLNVGRLKYRNLDGIGFLQRNLEEDFADLGRFDIIFNFGLIYHLRDVSRHLRTCMALADEMLLESVVCDSTSPELLITRTEDPSITEEALLGVGSRPSPFYIERIAAENGFAFDRYFDADLNVGRQYRYDWIHRDDASPNDDFVNRRFWRMTRTRGEIALPRGAAAREPEPVAAMGK